MYLKLGPLEALQSLELTHRALAEGLLEGGQDTVIPWLHNLA